MRAIYCHSNQSSNQINPKTLCSTSPYLMRLFMKCYQNWSTDFRDTYFLKVWTDDGPHCHTYIPHLTLVKKDYFDYCATLQKIRKLIEMQTWTPQQKKLPDMRQLILLCMLDSGFPQALEVMENLESHEKKFHAQKNHGI